MHNLASNSARRHHQRAGEVDFALLRAHPPAEVAVGGADGDFSLSGNTHVVAHTRAATGTLDHRARLDECTQVSRVERRQIHLRRGRDDNQPHARRDPAPLQHPRRQRQVA